MVSPELTASLIQTFKIFDDFGLYEIKDFLTITLYPEMIHEDLLPKMGNAISAMAVPTCDPCADGAFPLRRAGFVAGTTLTTVETLPMWLYFTRP